MEEILAGTIENLEYGDILKVLRGLRSADRDAYTMLEELINDL